MAEDRGPGELADAGPLGEAEAAAARSARSICTHRPRTWTSGVASLTRAAIPAASSFQVVEEHRPLHVGQLLHANLRRPDRFGEEPQLRSGPTLRHDREHGLEPGSHQSGPGGEHQVCRLVIIEDYLTPAGTGPAEHGQQPFQPPQLSLDLLGLRS